MTQQGLLFDGSGCADWQSICTLVYGFRVPTVLYNCRPFQKIKVDIMSVFLASCTFLTTKPVIFRWSVFQCSSNVTWGHFPFCWSPLRHVQVYRMTRLQQVVIDYASAPGAVFRIFQFLCPPSNLLRQQSLFSVHRPICTYLGFKVRLMDMAAMVTHAYQWNPINPQIKKPVIRLIHSNGLRFETVSKWSVFGDMGIDRPSLLFAVAIFESACAAASLFIALSRIFWISACNNSQNRNMKLLYSLWVLFLIIPQRRVHTPSMVSSFLFFSVSVFYQDTQGIPTAKKNQGMGGGKKNSRHASQDVTCQ